MTFKEFLESLEMVSYDALHDTIELGEFHVTKETYNDLVDQGFNENEIQEMLQEIYDEYKNGTLEEEYYE